MLRRVGAQVAAASTPGGITGGTFHHVAHQAAARARGGARLRPRLLASSTARTPSDVMAAASPTAGCAVGQRRFPKADVLVDLVLHGDQHPDAAGRGGGRRAGRSSCRSPTSCCGWPRRYAERKRELNAMDFDDLLLNWKVLLAEQRAGARGRWPSASATSWSTSTRTPTGCRATSSTCWRPDHQNLCVVGDDAQSHLLASAAPTSPTSSSSEKRYPAARRFALTVNYRSTPQILALANASIACNLQQFEKELTSVRADGPLPALVPCRDAVPAGRLHRPSGCWSCATRACRSRRSRSSTGPTTTRWRSRSSWRGAASPSWSAAGCASSRQAHVKDVLAFLRFVAQPGRRAGLEAAA